MKRPEIRPLLLARQSLRAIALGGKRGGRVSAITPVRCLSIAREHLDKELAEQLLAQYPES